MKKAFLSAGCIVLVLIFTHVANAGSILSISSQTVTLGNTATVTLDISGIPAGTALGVYDLNVGFRSTTVGFLSAAYGDPLLGDQLDLEGFGTATLTTPGTGTVELFELSFDSPSVLLSSQAKDFTLVTLTFNTVAVGQSPLLLSINALGDENGGSFSASLSDGMITVNPGTTPEPSTIVMLGSGIVWMTRAFRRKPR